MYAAIPYSTKSVFDLPIARSASLLHWSLVSPMRTFLLISYCLEPLESMSGLTPPSLLHEVGVKLWQFNT